MIGICLLKGVVDGLIQNYIINGAHSMLKALEFNYNNVKWCVSSRVAFAEAVQVFAFLPRAKQVKSSLKVQDFTDVPFCVGKSVVLEKCCGKYTKGFAALRHYR